MVLKNTFFGNRNLYAITAISTGNEIEIFFKCNFRGQLMVCKGQQICANAVYKDKVEKKYNSASFGDRILQGLGVGPGSATERWPSRKIARK